MQDLLDKSWAASSVATVLQSLCKGLGEKVELHSLERRP
jgi:hypothetical protein